MSTTTTQPNTGQPSGLDPTILALTRAIGTQESGGQYNRVGDNGHSYGAYQWNNGGTPLQAGQVPINFKNDAGKYLGDPNAPMTPANQDKVAYMKIADLASQGFKPPQIASIWNTGTPNGYKTMGKGYNAAQGVSYDPMAYVNGVAGHYQKFYNELVPKAEAAGTTPDTTPTPAGTGAQLQDTGSFIGNLWNSTKNLGSSLANVALHPIDTITNLAKIPLGGVEKLAGSTPDTNTAAFDNVVHFFGQRYGGSSPQEVAQNIGHTAYTDPVGFLADLSTVLTGGGSALGTVGKVGDLAKVADVTDAAKAAEAAKTTDFVANAAGEGGVATPVGEAAAATPTPNIVTRAGQAVSKAGEAINPFSIAGQGLSTVGDVTGLSGKLGDLGTSIKNVVSSPATAEAEAALAKLGVSPESVPASMTNPSPLVNTLETLSAKGAGAGTFAEKMANLNSTLDNVANTTLEHAGQAQDLSTSGQNIAEGLSKYQKVYKAATEDLYNKFEKKGSGLTAKVSNTTDLLNKIIDDKNAIGEDASFFNKKLDVITGGETKTADYKLPTFATLKAIRTSIGEKIGSQFLDPFVKQNIGQLKQLYGSLTQDMNDTVKANGNRTLAKALTQAETHYKEGLATLQTGFAKQIRRFAANGQFDKIIPTLLKKSTSIDDIPKIRTVIGEDNFKQLQYHMLDSIFENGKSIGAENFAKNGIDRAIKTFGEDKVKAILSPEQFDTLKSMQKVIRMTDEFKHLGQGSQTGFIAKTVLEGGLGFSGIGDLLTGNIGGFLTKISPIIGDHLASKFIASDTGQTLLREGIDGLKKPQIFNTRPVRLAGKIISGGAKQVYNKTNLPRNTVVERSQNQ